MTAVTSNKIYQQFLMGQDEHLKKKSKAAYEEALSSVSGDLDQKIASLSEEIAKMLRQNRAREPV